MDDFSSTISVDFLNYQYEVLGIAPFLNNPEVTEICINKPGEVFLETIHGWQNIKVDTLTFDRARQFCTAVVNESNTGQRITETEPMVSLTFPTGQRAQFVIPPACDAEKVSITIRLPSKHTKSLSQYSGDGFFSQIIDLNGGLSDHDKELVELIQPAEIGKTYLPHDLITIEDPEHVEVNGEGKRILVQLNKEFTYNGEPVSAFVTNGTLEQNGTGVAWKFEGKE